MSTIPPKPRPGGWAFLIPVAIWLVFSVVATVLLVGGISRQDEIVDDFDRVADGTQATVTLDEGGHTIWLERPGIDDEIVYSAELDVAITAPDGSTVPTATYVGDVSYSQGGRDGMALLTFEAPTDGDYTIAPSVNDSTGGGIIAIGTENPLSAIGAGIGLFIGVGTVGFLIALVVFIVIMVKRGRSKKQIRAATAASYGGYPQGGYPQGGYQQGGYPPPAGYGTPPPGYGTPPPGPAPGGPGPWGAPPPPPPG